MENTLAEKKKEILAGHLTIEGKRGIQSIKEILILGLVAGTLQN